VDNAWYQLWFAVRYIHVASVALLTGGAVTLCALCVRPRGAVEAGRAVLAAPAYEWMFWSAVGITVVTGVSNLGLKGDGLMAPETMWGRALRARRGRLPGSLGADLVRDARRGAQDGTERRGGVRRDDHLFHGRRRRFQRHGLVDALLLRSGAALFRWTQGDSP
jgi:hypothetical protein